MPEITHLDRFLRVMNYESVDRPPNWEAGVWGQTKDRWREEGLPEYTLRWDWFTGEAYFGFDPREFINISWGMMPPFETKVLERTDRHEIVQDSDGRVRKALIEGTSGNRACMDQYIRFAVHNAADFDSLKKRYPVDRLVREPAYWREFNLPAWKARHHVLVLGRNCAPGGFYWRTREWMGTRKT